MNNKKYIMYLKATDMKTFKAMDLGSGCTVDKLIYASIIPGDKAQGLLTSLTSKYPEYKFKLKAI